MVEQKESDVQEVKKEHFSDPFTMNTPIQMAQDIVKGGSHQGHQPQQPATPVSLQSVAALIKQAIGRNPPQHQGGRRGQQQQLQDGSTGGGLSGDVPPDGRGVGADRGRQALLDRSRSPKPQGNGAGSGRDAGRKGGGRGGKGKEAGGGGRNTPAWLRGHYRASFEGNVICGDFRKRHLHQPG